MIKYISCILFVLFFGQYSFGQARLRAPVRRGYPLNRVNQSRPGGKLEQVKETFIGKQLKLSSNESRTFWPVYRQYIQELTAVRILKRINNSDKSIDKTEQITKDLDYDSQMVSIKRQYNSQFLKILPPEKVSELYKSERAFVDEMLNNLNERSGVRAGD
ncbi:MAG: hypothetical protein M3N14_00995 [Bacteroidota bacterium]|nr:hypothetical protein [Bacteroidota bacterium]